MAVCGAACVSVEPGRATGDGVFWWAAEVEFGAAAVAAQAMRWRASVSRLAASTAVRT
jgi:hypothetical protein